ncbi:thiazole synthase [Paenibacillus sp. L3-i20]|uniref:thiazole synthase n=1 Tax=Paenibacillus sp. L3-i20 TaxID=2905833 RepID=UPI001EDDADB9|nr:thiazole synthase [Paenibacillus sp. L3-i20]GKU80200.1 thiazole synthase [Paenibacillus sp. L3-i20]
MDRYVGAEPFVIGGKQLTSRFFLGTGRFPSPAVLQGAIDASGTDVITFAVRRVNLEYAEDDSILQHVSERTLTYLPNTSGARTAEEAVRIAKLARAAGLGDWIKVEISGSPITLLPDPFETLKATEQLVKEGFVVLPYTSDDPILCKRLEEAGASAVMPGASPIGTGLGLLNPYNLSLIIADAKVPIIVDAGIGSPKDAAEAMELGAAAVLANTPIAKAKNPIVMARAFALAIEAGRMAHKAGRIPKKKYASASSDEAGSLFPEFARSSGAGGNG